MMRRTFGWLLIATLLCLLPAPSGGGAADQEGIASRRTWRFGYSSALLVELSRGDAKAALTMWSRELTRTAGYPLTPEAVIYDDLPSLVSAIRNRTVDLVAVSTMDYLKIRDQVALEPAFIGTRNGKPSEEQVLLVRRDSGVNTLADLRSRRLTLAAGWAGISRLWLDSLLAKEGLPRSEAFFGSWKETRTASQAILPVFFRQADVGLVNRSAFLTASELNPQIGKDLAVLATSPPFVLAVSCLRGTLSRKEKEEFTGASLRLVSSPAGRQMLTLFRVDGIVRAEEADLGTVMALVKDRESADFTARRR